MILAFLPEVLTQVAQSKSLRKMKVYCAIFNVFIAFLIGCHASVNIYEDFVRFKDKFKKIYEEGDSVFTARFNVYKVGQPK